MKKLLRQLFMLSIAMAPLWLLAQQTVTGTVTASDTGEPLIGATVRVDGTTTGALTNNQGAFSVQVSNENCDSFNILYWLSGSAGRTCRTFNY